MQYSYTCSTVSTCSIVIHFVQLVHVHVVGDVCPRRHPGRPAEGPAAVLRHGDTGLQDHPPQTKGTHSPPHPTVPQKST